MKGYGPYSDEDIQAWNRVLGHEIAQNYSPPSENDTLSTMVPKMEARHGLIDANTLVSPNLVPTNTSQDRVGRMNDVLGSTMVRGVDYPTPNPYARAIYLNEKNIREDSQGTPAQNMEYQLAVLDHELNHAQEQASGGPWRPHGTSRDNAKEHFRQSDEPGQMFNYEGKEAIRLMLERMKRHAQGQP